MLDHDPVIPYFQIPSLFGVIHAFGVLVAIGILAGAHMVKVRARQLGLDDLDTSSMVTWGIVAGFIGAHVFDIIFYQPEVLLERPWALLDPRTGLSSFGGFAGALIGIVWWVRRNKQPMFPFADAAAFGLVTGWLFGRLGCFSAHDHPGRHTSFWLAVSYPDGPRFDLGLNEAIFALVVSSVFLVMSRWKMRVGVYVTTVCLVYAPVRFFLDFLRATDVRGSDARYYGLTPAQYACIATFITGIVLLVRTLRTPAAGAPSATATVAPPQKQPARG